jgi:DNA-binding NtrC family response regulator
MQEIDELISAMAPSEANVLITGESGVGKEVIANVIHSRSRRARQTNGETQLCRLSAGDD